MDALKRYFRSPAAVAGLILLLVVIAMAASASFFYPRDPLALAGRPLIWPISNPRFLLGTDNSGRDIAAQIAQGESGIIGVMMESFLVDGRQDLRPGASLVYGCSITDACMSWEMTVPVLEELAEAVRARRTASR